MFQSSRIASGNPRLQTSSAFSPSSASMIWKSISSRIRLAIFRMTLESSTTRHVLIYLSFPNWDVAICNLRYAGSVVDGVFLAAVVGELEPLADLIDQQAIGFAAQIDAHRHRRLAVVVLRQAETGAHVHHRDDAAAQIEHTGDLAG